MKNSSLKYCLLHNFLFSTNLTIHSVSISNGRRGEGEREGKGGGRGGDDSAGLHMNHIIKKLMDVKNLTILHFVLIHRFHEKRYRFQ